MKRSAFNDGWSRRIWGVPGSQPVTLPHDHSQYLPRCSDAPSGSAGGFYRCEDVIYDRELTVTPEMLEERVILEFEGVMANAQVYLDDMLIAKQMNGYTTFHADPTPHLRPGVQKIRVNTANNAQPASRWYTGCGIYRPVWLMRAPKACIEPWGLSIVTTMGESGLWHADVAITVSREAVHPDAALRITLTDRHGSILTEHTLPLTDTTQRARLSLQDVTPWSPDSPELYRCTAELLVAEKIVDSESTPFGFRTVALDHDKGLLLNGEPIKLWGGCVHHDNGLLGAASYADAEYRKARLLKENGFNAVRCAHNPPSPAFLDACDQLGLMVMDEFTDVWNIGKNPYDYHLFFREHWMEDLRAMVLRDRNHPSILMWSIGNEIPERDGSGEGYRICRELAETVRSLDPTRLVTAGLNNIGKRRMEMLDANLQNTSEDDIDYFGELSRRFLEPLDVAGYNYLGHRYMRDLARFPDRYICGTESVVKECCTYYQTMRADPRIIGDFAWAAIDYLGESGIGHVWYTPEDGQGYFERFPWRQGNCADIDLCGHRRPCAYYRDAARGRLNAPYIAVQHPKHYHDDGDVSYWGWPERYNTWDYPGCEGKPIQVDVYAAGDEVTLLLNSEVIGVSPCREGIATFDLTYTPGTLEAVDETGHRSVLHTPSAERQLQITCDRADFTRKGQLCYVTATLTDSHGTPCIFDTREIRFTAEGGTLLAVGSADPSSEELFTTDHARSWNGCVCAVIRTEDAPCIAITAHGEGLQDASIILTRRDTNP